MNAQLKPMDNGLSPLRVGRITGSRIAAVLGLNQYSRRAEVLREMVREACGAQREFTGNDATRWGQVHEPDALAAYEAERGCMTYGGGEIVLHPLYDFLAVTPDGYVGDDGLIECKAPYGGTYTTIAEVPYYLPQVQLQMACTGRVWCDFVVWRKGVISIDRVMADPDFVTRHLGVLQNFMDDYADGLKNPEPHLSPLVRERKEPAWIEAARLYREAEQRYSDAEADKRRIRQVLIDLADENDCRGGGVRVSRGVRAGTVAYAKALKDLLPDADLSAYTSAQSTIYTITIDKEKA